MTAITFGCCCLNSISLLLCSHLAEDTNIRVELPVFDLRDIRRGLAGGLFPTALQCIAVSDKIG